MKIERLNDNQVKCTLTSFDLTERNLNLKELSYGNEKVKGLFTEMMQLAHNEVGFETDDMPVMIEAIPLQDNSVVLIITKVEEAEEVDTRFARFAPMPEIEALPQVMATAEIVNQEPVRVFLFNSIDQVSDVAKILYQPFDGKSSLYKNKKTGRYYLVVDGRKMDTMMFASTCNILSEYGELSMQNYSGKAYLDEHYDLIIKNKALEVLAEI